MALNDTNYFHPVVDWIMVYVVATAIFNAIGGAELFKATIE